MIFRDTFGNLITNISADHLGDVPRSDWEIEIAGERIVGILAHIRREAAGNAGQPWSAAPGWVEVAVVNGDAGRQLTAGAGTTVWLRRRG